MRKGWEIKRLDEVCDMYQPKTISSKNMIQNGDYPVFGANGIIGSYNKYNHENPQLLVTCRGATCGSVNISLPKSWINGNAMVIRPKDESLNMEFITYLFLGGINISEVITGSAQPQITRQSLNPVRIPIPPLKEQQQIVALLDDAFIAIDKAKANIEKNIENAKELFQSKLNAVFSQKGDGWEEKTLGELTTKIGSGSTPRGGQASYKEEGISLIRSMNVHDSGFKIRKLAFIDNEQAGKLKNVTIQEDDVLLNITGASVARCCVAPVDYLPARVNQHVSIIRPRKDLINSNYLHFLLTSKTNKNLLLGIGEQGSTRQAITKTQIERFTVCYPVSIENQIKLVEEINEIKKDVKKFNLLNKRKLLSLEELKKSILQKAFAGELTNKMVEV